MTFPIVSEAIALDLLRVLALAGLRLEQQCSRFIIEGAQEDSPVKSPWGNSRNTRYYGAQTDRGTIRMDAIAQGVETAQQLEQLRSLPCEYG